MTAIDQIILIKTNIDVAFDSFHLLNALINNWLEYFNFSVFAIVYCGIQKRRSLTKFRSSSSGNTSV